MRILRSFGGVCLFFLTTSCAQSTVLDESSSEQEIGFGNIEDDANYPWVVRISNGGGPCHGTLIDPHWILTAGHCAYGANPITVSYTRKNPTTGVVTAGSQMVVEKQLGPGYDNNSLANDIALLRIARTLTAGQPADPLLQPLPLTPGEPFQGQVGFVASYQNNGGAQLAPGKIAVYNAPITLAGFQNSFIAKSSTSTICPGDSGSGYVVRTSGGQYVLLGVVSALLQGDASPSAPDCLPPQGGTLTATTNVRRYDSWIRGLVPNLPPPPVPPVGSSDILWRCVPQSPATSCGAAGSGASAIWVNGIAGNTVYLWQGVHSLDWQIVGVGDFDGNGKSDFLWRNSVTGENVVWPNGTNAGYYVTSLSPFWKVAGIGDFNGNGKSDILWRDGNGNNAIWTDTISPGYWISAAATNWKVAGIGDFDANGKSDILWRDTSGNNSIWPNAAAPGYWPAGVSTSWSVAGIGDFNADGKSDILWRSINGDNAIWPGAVSPGYGISFLDTGWQVVGVGDFDGNVTSDILWRRANGENAVWHDGSAVWTTWLEPLSTNWKTAGVGNFLP